MLTRVVSYLAAFIVASVAVVGFAAFNQLSFPVACLLMIVFTCLLAYASDVPDVQGRHRSRSQMPAALTNHLQAASGREPHNSNDSNNSNCIRAHSDVELPTFCASTSDYIGHGTATISGRTSARGRGHAATNRPVILTLPQAREADEGRTNRVPLFGSDSHQTELRRPSLRSSNRVPLSDSIRTPARTLMTPSASGLSADGVRSHQHLLPQFQQRQATGLVLCHDLDL